MPPPPKPLRQPASEPKLQKRLRKRPRIKNENKVEQEDFVEVEAPNESRMRTEGPHNQVQKPKTDLSGTSGENLPVEGLLKPARKFAKSVIETSSKVQEAKTSDEAISDLIYVHR